MNLVHLFAGQLIRLLDDPLYHEPQMPHFSSLDIESKRQSGQSKRVIKKGAAVPAAFVWLAGEKN